MATVRSIKRISTLDALDVFDSLRKLFPDLVVREDRLFSIIGSVGNDPRDLDIEQVAACYLYKVARGHPLTNGNKRLALCVMNRFLNANGLCYSTHPADHEDMVKILNGIAEGSLSEEDVAPRLAIRDGLTTHYGDLLDMLARM